MCQTLIILGPTASGKTGLSLELARRLGGEIVNADALQAYRGLDIGTDKPTAEMRRQVRHHLVDILEPAETFSAGEFARRARRAIADIRQRGRSPLVVGGSGLYLRALLEGLSPLPQRRPEIRRQLEEELQRRGLEHLRQQLWQVDPSTAERLHKRDRQRILRALEVYRSSGQAMSKLLGLKPVDFVPLAARRIGLTVPRTILYDRIADRINAMVERGWVSEIMAMLKRGVEPSVPAFQAIGYRQMVRHITGELTLEAAIAETVQATRRYAKRQLTWFRREPEVFWVSGLDAQSAASTVLRSIHQ